ncbi:MAG: ISKra4 family transposase [Myxococcaceae bacterium]|nr:ISKra4 family transposase [Myxococcaceae bacterium]MCI0670333.1 ISKra4 family transposase [Myxococcaceae bacterium]
MPKVTVEVPEELAEAVRKLVKDMEAGVAEIRSGRPLDFAALERRAAASAAEVEREVVRRLLRHLDIDASRVRVDGRLHARVGRYPSTYKTQAGPVEVERSLYREVGVRNGPTVDAVSLRAGCVADGWLPEAARGMAHLIACGTSREAEGTARALHRLPYCRSSFERVGHEVGALYGEERPHVEAALADAMDVPEGTFSLSLSLDRVALPMEEPKPRPVGRPRKGAPRRPVDVVWRMAYVGTLTFHDAKGEALAKVEAGRTPEGDARQLAHRLALDAKAVLTKQPSLKLVILTDGAPELQGLLDAAVQAHLPGVPCWHLTDFWHVAEKLGRAAVLIHGEAGAPPVVHRWKALLLNSENARGHLLNELYRSGKQHVRVAQERPVHEAIRYLHNQGERMGYALARAEGLPVGSGNVEATCKSLVALRMKRPGSRWKEETGQHVLDLRALVLSDRWDTAMNLTLAPLRAQVRRAA